MPSYLPGIWYKEQCLVSSGEDGRVRRSSAHFVVWIHPDNTYISVNNPENNQQTRRTDSPQLIIEKRAIPKTVGRAETWSRT